MPLFRNATTRAMFPAAPVTAGMAEDAAEPVTTALDVMLPARRTVSVYASLLKLPPLSVTATLVSVPSAMRVRMPLPVLPL